jgi:hypothetical protein
MLNKFIQIKLLFFVGGVVVLMLFWGPDSKTASQR